MVRVKPNGGASSEDPIGGQLHGAAEGLGAGGAAVGERLVAERREPRDHVAPYRRPRAVPTRVAVGGERCERSGRVGGGGGGLLRGANRGREADEPMASKLTRQRGELAVVNQGRRKACGQRDWLEMRVENEGMKPIEKIVGRAWSDESSVVPNAAVDTIRDEDVSLVRRPNTGRVPNSMTIKQQLVKHAG